MVEAMTCKGLIYGVRKRLSFKISNIYHCKFKPSFFNFLKEKTSPMLWTTVPDAMVSAKETTICIDQHSVLLSRPPTKLYHEI